MKTGTIKQLKGEPGSGLAELFFEDGSSVLVENYGVRQLFDAFEDAEKPHRIKYSVNKHNIMTGFDVI
jgi:hypothetical protein